VAEAAEKLGIYPSQIYSWRSALNNSRTGAERESLLATENAPLKRQNDGLLIILQDTTEIETSRRQARELKQKLEL
jgi:transposase-like protein